MIENPASSSPSRRSRILLVISVALIGLLAATTAHAAPKKRPTTTTTTSSTSTSTSTTLASTPTPTTAAPTAPVGTGTWPSTPPAKICGDTSILNGPSTAPAGAILVPAGDNVGFNFNQPGKTFYFASGIHTLGTTRYGQIIPAANTTFIGAPGAIIDGQNRNVYAFTARATGVTIKHLTIRNFGTGLDNNNEGVVNHDAGDGWTIEYNTVIGNDGAGVFIGSDNVVRYNCLKDNGQYGFSSYKPAINGDNAVVNVLIDHNEIVGNNTDDWESRIPGCGCTGAGKLWDTRAAKVTNNWVHDNLSQGLWSDSNNADHIYEGNWIESNQGIGLFYELSYNAAIRNNVFRRNAIVQGQEFAGRGDTFPIGAIYLSEAGGDSRVRHDLVGAGVIDIANNSFVDNWGGVVAWENADRFCGSAANTSTGTCTKVNESAVNINTCNATNLPKEPYYTDCRWLTNNVSVRNNEFSINRANLGNCNARYCGRQGVFSNWGSWPDYSPYKGDVVQKAITFAQNNKWSNNKYFGGFRFTAFNMGTDLDFAGWTAAPYIQDAGSTSDGSTPTVTTTSPTSTTTTTATSSSPTTSAPVVSGSHLDTNTSGLEGGVGQWAAWYSANVSRSTEKFSGGEASLKVDITAPNGSGVSLNNWPGFAATAGNKRIGFSGTAGVGAPGATMTVKWRDTAGNDLQVDKVSVPSLGARWTFSSADVVAPAGTARVWVEITTAGNAGDSIYLDDIVVATR